MVLISSGSFRVFVKCCVLCLLFAPLRLFGQKLKTESFDQSAKKWRIETFPANLKSDPEAKTNVSLLAADTAFVLQLAGSGIGTSTVDIGSELVFLLDNDSTVIARSPAIQGIDFQNLVSTYQHRYLISFLDIQALSRHNVKGLRKFSAGGVDDIPIEKKNAGKVKELSSFFIAKVKEKKLYPDKPLILSPGFPGGKEVMLSFLNRNVKPLPGIQNGEKKTAIVQFVVAADGSTKDIQVKTSVAAAVDDELIRILKRMPRWKPALQNGKAVDFVVTQPVTFMRMNDSLKIQL
ncbi:MAG TPA: energy transducer TonB [Flavisolibacter sp.]